MKSSETISEDMHVTIKMFPGDWIESVKAYNDPDED